MPRKAPSCLHLILRSTGATGYIGGDALYLINEAHPDWVRNSRSFFYPYKNQDRCPNETILTPSTAGNNLPRPQQRQGRQSSSAVPQSQARLRRSRRRRSNRGRKQESRHRLPFAPLPHPIPLLTPPFTKPITNINQTSPTATTWPPRKPSPAVSRRTRPVVQDTGSTRPAPAS